MSDDFGFGSSHVKPLSGYTPPSRPHPLNRPQVAVKQVEVVDPNAGTSINAIQDQLKERNKPVEAGAYTGGFGSFSTANAAPQPVVTQHLDPQPAAQSEAGDDPFTLINKSFGSTPEPAPAVKEEVSAPPVQVSAPVAAGIRSFKDLFGGGSSAPAPTSAPAPLPAAEEPAVTPSFSSPLEAQPAAEIPSIPADHTPSFSTPQPTEPVAVDDVPSFSAPLPPAEAFVETHVEAAHVPDPEPVAEAAPQIPAFAPAAPAFNFADAFTAPAAEPIPEPVATEPLAPVLSAEEVHDRSIVASIYDASSETVKQAFGGVNFDALTLSEQAKFMTLVEQSNALNARLQEELAERQAEFQRQSAVIGSTLAALNEIRASDAASGTDRIAAAALHVLIDGATHANPDAQASLSADGYALLHHLTRTVQDDSLKQALSEGESLLVASHLISPQSDPVKDYADQGIARVEEHLATAASGLGTHTAKESERTGSARTGQYL